MRVIGSTLIELPLVDLSRSALVLSSLRNSALNAIIVQDRHSTRMKSTRGLAGYTASNLLYLDTGP